ncbi:hypothetical protein LguiA_009900 [Lonicera macranthoides]
MENSDLNRSRSRSYRINSSSIWTSHGTEIFSRSSHEADDEEALKWAALQRLPTYDRLKKGLLTGSRGEVTETDIHNLGDQENRTLIERLVGVAEQDNEKFLLKLKERIDRVGIDIPTVEVRFEHLKVDALTYIGSRALPSLANFFFNRLEEILDYLHLIPSRKKHLPIFRDVSGIIKPCRMTLLLGPPSSGKTTLLLALAGKLDPDLKFFGRVSYNGHDMHEFVPLRTAAYISQHDLHFAQMTVRETLAFSARCQGVGSRYEMIAELSRREKAANIKPDPDIDIFMKAAAREGQESNVMVDYILKVLGLELCADTLVGNEMLRGISGGQKKRLTIGEMLVGPANVLLMDEISTGLDSSTAFQIINLLKQYIHIFNGTAVISLLQPAPETYSLFDDILLLSDGYIVYQGPREHVLEFFESMGFKCPARKGVADFLQEVTSRKDQMQYWANEDKAYRFVNVKEFAEAFRSFHVGRNMGDELATPFQKAQSHPAALATRKYGVGKKEIFKTCLSREILLLKRNSLLHIFHFAVVLIMALLTMTLFIRTNMHRNSLIDGVLYSGSLFFVLSWFMFSAFSELAILISQLPVFHKQRDLLFYPAWAYSIPTWMISFPLILVEVFAWVLTTYYVIGYDPDVGRLFRQCLLLLVFRLMASGLFRFFGALGRNMNVAYTYGTTAMLLLFALGGFVLSREPLGIVILKSRGLFAEAYWYWIGVGASIGFAVLFNFLLTLALTYLRSLEKHQAFISEETPSEEHNVRTGEPIWSSPNESSVVQMTETTFGDGRNGNEMRNTSTSSLFTKTKENSGTNNVKKGMVLPFEQYSITFDEIRYSVDMPLEMKNQGVNEDRLELLKGVSGAFRPGILTALMGVSGAGKTTLMDVLAGRKTGGYIEGNIKISGYQKKQETFARISGYCEQNDIHSPYVTVYESLLFSAWLRLSSEVSAEAIKMFIDEVMELVELTSLKEALVGLPGVNGLSIEQRKRLTIAVELVANPSIIFMDEPTSGVDARAAGIVMRTVRNIVDTGRTIVCTIHQPSIHIFEAFDELFLMTYGGQEIYVGPLGRHSCHLVEYFEIVTYFFIKGIEGIPKIKDGDNPSTWALEVTTREQEVVLGVNFNDVYRNSELYRRNKALIRELSIPPPDSKDLYFTSEYSRSFLTQFKACLWKQHWSYWRNTSYTAVRYVCTIVIALLFGTIFWNLGSKRKKIQDLYNAIGSMYTAVLFIGVQNASTVQPVVSTERTVFYRERSAGMYSALPYAFAQVVVELPHIFVQAIVYGVTVYAMMGFEWNLAKFLWYIFFMYMTFLYFTYFGMMNVSMTPNQNLAAMLASPFYALWNLFSGYLIPQTRAPVWWRWYYWICPFAWTLHGLVVSQFGEVKDELEEGITVEEFVSLYLGYRRDYLGVVAATIPGTALLFALGFAFSMYYLNFQRR